MPRAFLVKHKRARVDSIADELLARHEMVHGDEEGMHMRGPDQGFSSSHFGQNIYPEGLSKRELNAIEMDMEARGLKNIHPAYTLAPGLYPPTPPLLRMSTGSAFEKVHPGVPMTENLGMGYGPLPGSIDPQRLVLNPWLASYHEITGHNILRDRLLSHPGYLIADPKCGLYQVPPRGYASKPLDEPLNLKIREQSHEEQVDEHEEFSRISKNSHPEDMLSLKKHSLGGPVRLPGAGSADDEYPRYHQMSSTTAIHPSSYPFIGIPYGHLLAHKYSGGFGLKPLDRNQYPSRRGRPGVEMSPPTASHAPPQPDIENPPICNVKPTFNEQEESSDSASPLTNAYESPTILNQPRFPVSQTSIEDDDSGDQSPSSPTGGKRLTRQPILGVEYIQNGIDNELHHDADSIQDSEQQFLLQDSEEQYLLQDGLNPISEGDKKTDSESNMDDRAILPLIPKYTGETKGRRANSAKTPQPRKYICDVCGKGFSRSNTLVTHKRIHTGDKPFACELCGRAFRQPGNLTRHRLTHTTVKPYVCTQCGKAFNRASNLHTHMRTHTNYKPFVCQYCGKGFHQKIDMKIHSYTHTGEKPHKCKKCGRGFKQLTHLTYHMRTHSEVKMYTCAYCGKGFNQKGNLQAHIYRHTGERPYRCEVCNKGFTLASTLNTHRRTHADKKPFACQYCGKDFYQRNALKSHLLASHPYTDGESLL
nr:zinc finger protein 768-like isoform X1 [Lytechinus pictus]